MSTPKAKSFNHQVFQKAYKRLNLSSTNRIVLQRLLGFLIRNSKPFPYSAVKLSELTGFNKRTIFRSLEELERCRLIKRIGMGINRRFIQGSILNKIFTTVTNRNKLIQDKNKTTATLCHQNSNNRDTVAYSKTSSSLKLKEKDGSLTSNHQKPNQTDFQEYAHGVKGYEWVGEWLEENQKFDQQIKTS